MELAKAHLTVVDIGIVENTDSNKRFELSQCKHVSVPTYSLASALKSNKSTPCTNAPIMCRKCPSKPMPVVIYKHSMAQHWGGQQSGIAMDKATKADIALGVNESSWVTQLLKRKTCK